MESLCIGATSSPTHAVVLFLGRKGLSLDNNIHEIDWPHIYNSVGVVTFTFAAYDGFSC